MNRVAVLLAIALLCPLPAAAAPQWVRLSLTHEADEMAVTWNTPDDEPSAVRWGPSGGDLSETVEGTSMPGPPGLGFVHEAVMTGLEPGEGYHYMVGSDAGGFSVDHPFTQPAAADPTCGTVTLGYIGDNRPDETLGGGENYPLILGQLATHSPNAVLNGGDMVIDGDDVGQWRDFLRDTTDVASTVPYLPTIGNHDDGPGEGDTAYYNQIFQLPTSEGEFGSGTEDYYYVTIGNVIIVSLSTDTFDGGVTPFADQAQWLDQVLTENPAHWKIVMFHKPAYTHEAVVGNHEPNEEGQNGAFVPVLDEHHVDLVLTSHNHWYERYEPSNCSAMGRPGRDLPCSTGADGFADGTVFIVSGGAGAFTIPQVLCQGLGSVAGRVSCRDEHHYLVIRTENERLVYEAWGAHPQENALIDSFEIVKPTGVDCSPPVTEDTAVADEPVDAGTPDAGSNEDLTPEEDVVDREDEPEVDAGEPPVRGEDARSRGEEDTTPAATPTPQGEGETGCSCRSLGSRQVGGGWIWIGLLGAALTLSPSRRRGRPRSRAR